MTTDPDAMPTREATVTCHTDECGNAGHAITVHVQDVPEPAVQCGVCGQPITDIT